MTWRLRYNLIYYRACRNEDKDVVPRLHVLLAQTIFTPFILTVIAVGMGFCWSWWSLVAVPFVWLGAFCSAPNLNLIDGCLPNVAILIGTVLIVFVGPLGIAITAGATLGYYLSSLEKAYRWHSAKDSSRYNGD